MQILFGKGRIHRLQEYQDTEKLPYREGEGASKENDGHMCEASKGTYRVYKKGKEYRFDCIFGKIT